MAGYTKNVLRREGTANPDAVGRMDMRVGQPDDKSAQMLIEVDFYNYGIDGNIPRREHKRWALTELAPFCRKNRYHIKLFGKSSRSGSAAAGQQVARERVLLLKEYLVEACGLGEAIVPGNEIRILGQHGASAHENQKDRAVQAILSPGWKTRPNPPPPPPSDPEWPQHDWSDYYSDMMDGPKSNSPLEKPRRKYRIRYRGGYGGSFMIGGEWHKFEVMDVETKKTMRFKVRGVAIGIGVHATPDSGTSWSKTFTSNARSLRDFKGRTAVLGSAGAPLIGKSISDELSVTGLSILGCDPVELDTGQGISVSQAPINASAGDLEFD